MNFELTEKDKKIIEDAKEMFFQGLADKIVEEFNDNPQYWIERMNEKNTDNGKA